MGRSYKGMDYPGNRRSDAIYPVKNTSDEVGCDTYFISYNRCVDLLDCNNYIIVHIAIKYCPFD